MRKLRDIFQFRSPYTDNKMFESVYIALGGCKL